MKEDEVKTLAGPHHVVLSQKATQNIVPSFMRTLVFSLKASSGWMRSVHPVEDSVLYSKSSDVSPQPLIGVWANHQSHIA